MSSQLALGIIALTSGSPVAFCQASPLESLDLEVFTMSPLHSRKHD
jgi:hypothetical protein